jgi:hypothetical protein
MAMCNITGHLYDSAGNVISYGIVTLQLQQDMVYNSQKVVPFTITIDLSTTSGFIDVTVFPTENAAPAGIAYKLEFDPDPADTNTPLKQKPGYFRNYLTVPDQASAALGSFVSALRGQPAVNYMPVGGSLTNVGDDLTLGTGTSTNKRIIANMSGATDPAIRYNNATSEWEFSNDGTTFQGMLQGGGGSVGGDLSGTVGSATVIKLQGRAVSSTAPGTTGQVLRWNNSSSQWEPSVDGTALNTSASNLTTGTVPLARLSGITNTEIAAAAAIAWTKISKTGSSLADLAVRSASDLSSGTVPTARLGSGTANSTTFLRGDQTWATVAGSGGDVVGPASAVDDQIATFDGTTGKLIQDGGKTIATVVSDAVAAAVAAIVPVDLTADVTGDLPLANIVPSAAAARLLGRGSSAGAGDWESITLGSGLAMSGNTLTASGGGGGGGAPDNALYVTLATDATLVNERVLTGSGRVSVTDGGAGGNVTIDLENNSRIRQIGITIDGGGSVITTGVKGYRSSPWTGTIVGVRLLADQSGSAVLDIWKDTYANYPPTVANTITASAKPTLSAAIKSEDTTLTGWTPSVTAGDVFGFKVDSASTVTWLVLELSILVS